MIDVGVIGLDTSHANAFAPIIESLDDMTLYGAWDACNIRDPSYVGSFCEEYDAQRYSCTSEMVDDIDAAMVLTANWETHRPLAEQFLKAGVPTFVDKPLTGSLTDLRALERAAEDAPLFGGSAVPFHADIDALPRGGVDRTIYAAGYNDYFYYRVHVVDVVRSLADADWSEVRLTDEPGTTVDVRFENGMHATLRFDGSEEDGAFSILDISDTTKAVQIDSGQDTLTAMYHPFIGAFRETAHRKRDDTTRLLDAGTLLLAVEAAVETDQPITPNCDAMNTVHADGEAFLADYEPYY